jgi:hypothetical protein
METKAKGKKITRSYVRGLLKKFKDLGVECVLWDRNEVWLEDATNQRHGEAFAKAVRILTAQDYYA